MSAWSYHNPTRVVFGPGVLGTLEEHVHGRVALVTTPGATKRGLTERIVAILGSGRVLVHDRAEPNPSFDRVDASIEELRGERVDTIVAVGGGSAMDTGKVLALALATPGARVCDLVRPMEGDRQVVPVRLVAVPTTAGTGSEVTPFATVWDTAGRRKHSVARPTLFPEVALVDPTLSVGLDWETTLSCGLDAYVQCFEAVYNRNANTVTTALAERGAMLVPTALRALKTDPDVPDERQHLAEAALLSGLAIGHTRTALAHSMSYPITALLGVPHGLACAVVFPAVLEFNLEVDDGRLELLARRAGLAGADALLDAVVDLYAELEVGRVVQRYLGRVEALGELAPEMLTPSRADNNLRPADERDVRSILQRTAELVGVGVVA